MDDHGLYCEVLAYNYVVLHCQISMHRYRIEIDF